MKHSLVAMFALFLALPLWASAAAAAEDAYEPQKIVYHVNFLGGEKDKLYMSTMGNVQNHINAVGKNNLDLQVVMNGDGLHLLMDAKKNTDLAQRIANLKSQGVQFRICANTLKGRNIALDDLYDAWESDVVPSGVAEVGKLQMEGYGYVKTY